MKTFYLKVCFACFVFSLFAGADCAVAQQVVDPAAAVHSGLRFCESTLPYRSGVLVSNFGGEVLDPLNDRGCGYISYLDGQGKVHEFIAADGNLSAPKGMAIYRNHLLVADVGRVVVYDLGDLGNKEKPQVVHFAADDKFVNDIVLMDDLALVSVTNTGRVYGLDLSDIKRLADVEPRLLGEVAGANGMLISDTTLYIASYNPHGVPQAENVIYSLNLGAGGAVGGELRPLITGLPGGQYDGIALSADGSQLYFTSWTGGTDGGGALYRYTLPGRAKIISRVTSIDLGVGLVGPADICITKNDVLYVPDLAGSVVYSIQL